MSQNEYPGVPEPGQQPPAPNGQQPADPYAAPAQNPYVQQPADPYGTPVQDPYAVPVQDPYAQQPQDPYAQQQTPFGQQPPQDPFGQQPQQNPYNQQQPPYAYGYAQPGYSLKSKMVAGLLGIFLGGLGVHNFYLGNTGKAVAQLLITILSLGFLSWVSAIWGLVEGILILVSTPGTPWHKDAAGLELRD